MNNTSAVCVSYLLSIDFCLTQTCQQKSHLDLDDLKKGLSCIQAVFMSSNWFQEDLLQVLLCKVNRSTELLKSKHKNQEQSEFLTQVADGYV